MAWIALKLFETYVCKALVDVGRHVGLAFRGVEGDVAGFQSLLAVFEKKSTVRL